MLLVGLVSFEKRIYVLAIGITIALYDANTLFNLFSIYGRSWKDLMNLRHEERLCVRESE